MCASTLLSFHQLYIICQSNNSRFLQSLEGEAYEHHVVKNQVVGDPIELLELQSSFSREIENEILNMHESKEINEAESEIAANMAVKELERIGSAENISLVEEVAIDVLHSMGDVKDETLTQEKSDENNEKSESKNSIDLKPVEIEKNTKNKTKKDTVRKPKIDEKSKVNVKSRAVKSPKKRVKSPKAEILKENITRSKSKKIEKTPPQSIANGKDVKENSCVESENQKYVNSVAFLNLSVLKFPHLLFHTHSVFSEHPKHRVTIVLRSLLQSPCSSTISKMLTTISYFIVRCAMITWPELNW